MKRVFVLFTIVLILGPLFFSSCRGQDAFYKDLYNEANAYVYPQCADNFNAMPGYNRVLLSWQKPVDPTVVKAIVYWNSGADSLIVDINDPQIYDADTVKVSIPLEEDSYVFNLYSFDAVGNRSNVVESSAYVYGDSYALSLSSRTPSSCKKNGNAVNIQWNTRALGLAYSEVKYESTSGEKIVKVEVLDTNTILNDYDFNNPQPISYRGIYEVKGCVDLLYQQWIDMGLPK